MCVNGKLTMFVRLVYSTAVWTGASMVCAIFVEDLRPLINDSAISSNVSKPSLVL